MLLDADTGTPRCPACRAPWRGQTTCRRCGADLEPVMRVAMAAWRSRKTAREAIARGDAEGALAAAGEAIRLERTDAALRLLVLAAALAGEDGLGAELARLALRVPRTT